MRLLVKGAAVASALALGLFPVLNGSANAAVETPTTTVVAKAPPPTGPRVWKKSMRTCNDRPLERYGQRNECVRLLKHLYNCHAFHHKNRKNWAFVDRTNIYGKGLVKGVWMIKRDHNDENNAHINPTGKTAPYQVWGGAARSQYGIYHHWNGIYSRAC